MFGLGKRDDRTVDAVREEMTAADTRARAVLANAMAQIEARLSNDREETARLQASTQAAIETLRFDVASRPNDIGPVLEQVAAMCALVAERLEADRLERRALTEAITLLAARPSLADAPSRVLGGTISPADALLTDHGLGGATERTPIAAIDLRSDAHDAPRAGATIDVEPVRNTPDRPATADHEPAGPTAEASQWIDVAPASTVAAPPPAVIDLVQEERFETTPPPSGAEIWNAFESGRADHAEPDPELDLRPRQGTRLTAARRSNVASWR